jgi:hypothetical protein
VVDEVTVEYESPAMMKLIRAGRHFESLEREVEDWNRENALLAPTKRSLTDAQALEVHLPAEPAVPVMSWASTFGDGIHNLRASLDLLAFEMCHLEGRTPKRPKDVYFPIAQRETDWAGKAKPLDTVPASLLSRVRQAQPWNASNSREHPLTLITGLDNQDKHRHTAVVLPMPSGLVVENLRPWGGSPDEDQRATPWIRVTLDRAIPDSASQALWRVGVWPVVYFEGRMAPLVDLQRWLYQQIDGIFRFIASGEWPTYSPLAPEPSWAALPDWGIGPTFGSSD